MRCANLFALKKKEQSRGCSRSLREELMVGTELPVGAPSNLFRLAHDAEEHVLIDVVRGEPEHERDLLEPLALAVSCGGARSLNAIFDGNRNVCINVPLASLERVSRAACVEDAVRVA